MKYNVGDKVRIKSLDWYNQMLSIPSKIVGKDDFVAIECGAHIFTKGMCKFCGRVMTIQDIGIDFYLMDEDVLGYEFTDEMIEGLVYRSGEGTWSFAEGQESHTKSSSELYKEHVENIDKETNKIIANAVAGEMLAVKTMLDCILAKGLLIPNGYEIKDENGNVINATKIVLEKKKKEYPKTYEECFNICFGNKHPIIQVVGLDGLGDNKELFESFIKLKICRDAYWQIAGEEMGLGKPWEPNWTSFEGYPAIYMYRYQITLSVAKDVHHCLVFPTEEMRDAFYENFNELIESCKELL